MVAGFLKAAAAAIASVLTRVRRLALLFASWAVIFSAITIANFKIGFEYDDGISFSTPAFSYADKFRNRVSEKDYWNILNRKYGMEKEKIVPLLAAYFFRIFGFRIHILSSRLPYGSDSLVHSWKPLANKFFFAPGPGERKKILEEEKYLLYFASSDEDILAAKRAGITPIRLKRGKLSKNGNPSHPGKFGEMVLPLSEF